MTEYRALSISEVAELLRLAENPLIIMHRRPDGDTVGSAVALMRLLQAFGKKVRGLCEDKMPERLAFLTDGLCIGRELPPPPFTAFAIDVASPAQLGQVAEMLEKAHASVRAMIDHHAIGRPFADHLILPEAAAAGEIVYDIAKEWQRTGHLSELPAEAERALYAALSSDTGCFRYSNVTPKTLRTAAALLERPSVDAADINHRLFEAKSERQLKAEAFAIEHTRVSHGGRVAWTIVTQADRRALGVEEEHLETVIDMVRSRAGVEVALAIRENPDGSFKASMRSNGFDVASVATLFGGGGHIRAAGCTAPGKTAEEAASTLLAEIDRRLPS